MAVVIQRLIPAEISGILFTANPVNGRRGQIVIDAFWGLGEAVVSGQVAPDHWVLDRSSGAVVEAKAGSKTVMTVQAERGTTLQPVDEANRDRLALTAAELAALADLGEKVDAHFGSPQDIEWAMAGGTLYLLQSRPITSLFPLPSPEPLAQAGLRVYACVNFLQGFPEPLTPMGIAAFRVFSRGIAATFGKGSPPGATPEASKVSVGRMYVDVTALLQHPRSRAVALAVPGIIDRPMVEIFRVLLTRDPSLTPPHPGFPIRLPVGFVLSLFSRVLLTALAPDIGRRMATTRAERYVKMIEERAARLKGIEERLDFLDGQDQALFPKRLIRIMAPVVAPAVASRFLAEAKLRKWLGDASGLQPVLRSLPHKSLPPYHRDGSGALAGLSEPQGRRQLANRA